MTQAPTSNALVGVIEVPIMGLPVNVTKVYVLEGAKGPILIDAGWADDEAWNVLVNGLSDLGTSVKEVEGVIATHHHPDHIGLAGRIQRASGAWVVMHTYDAHLAQAMSKTESRDIHLTWELDNLAAAGAPSDSLDAYRRSGGSFSMAVPDVDVIHHVNDRDTIRSGDLKLRAMWLPGHTRGHMGVVNEADKIAFTGDHVLSKTSPHIGEFVFPVDEYHLLGRFLDSLEDIKTLSAQGYSIKPAHESLEIDWCARIDEIKQHHHHRLDDVRTVLSDGKERTLWQTASEMKWAVEWGDIEPLGWQLALSECSAHLTYLIDTGEIQPSPAENSPQVFTKSQ